MGAGDDLREDHQDSAPGELEHPGSSSAAASGASAAAAALGGGHPPLPPPEEHPPPPPQLLPPPAEPPPPPHAKGRGRGRGRGRVRLPRDLEEDWERWPLPDGLGEIVYNPADKSLDAHCNHGCHAACRLNRTINEGPRAAQGRPMGQLLAWLLAQGNYTCRQLHFDVRKDEAVVGFPQRLAARNWGKLYPQLAGAFAKERPMDGRDRGFEEPLGLPG
jgi:hypothetical protein